MPDAPTQSGPPRVLFISTSCGAGHNQAAAAVQAALAQACPSVQAEFLDTLKLVPWWFRLYYGGGYKLMVTKLPWLYGFGYWLTDRPQRPGRGLTERPRLCLERLALRRVVARALALRPVLVVATHYAILPALSRALARGAPGLRLMAVVTDNEAHRWWYGEGVERYFVPNEGVVDQLGRWGIGPERITLSGIPIHPKWSAPLDRPEIYRRWNLPADVHIVLLSGGTYFTVGPVGRVARGILANSRAHVVVLCGNNKALLNELAGYPEAQAAGGQPARLTGVPFTDRGHELAEVASLMVTKAGGLTTTECLAKGLAMVFTGSIPGQEAANARMFAREGAGVVAETPEAVIAEVTRLLNDPPALAAMRANARRLYRPGTATIVAGIRQALGV